MPEQLLEFYRFLAAVCINLHWSNFDGLELVDVWQEQTVPYPEQMGAMRQLAEDVGGLWPYLRGDSRMCGSIDVNLQVIESILANLLQRYPDITFKRGAFSRASDVYCLDRDSRHPSFPALGDHPDPSVWELAVPPEGYGHFKNCIDNNGCWRRQLTLLLPVFTMARVRIFSYL